MAVHSQAISEALKGSGRGQDQDPSQNVGETTPLQRGLLPTAGVEAMSLFEAMERQRAGEDIQEPSLQAQKQLDDDLIKKLAKTDRNLLLQLHSRIAPNVGRGNARAFGRAVPPQQVRSATDMTDDALRNVIWKNTLWFIPKGKKVEERES